MAEQQDADWRKPTVSVPNGACVEVARGKLDVMVRDSKDQQGPVLHFKRPSWRSFIYKTKINQLCFHADGQTRTVHRDAA